MMCSNREWALSWTSWSGSLGLGKYEAAFRENEIDETVLPNLTAEDLKQLGKALAGTRALNRAVCVPLPSGRQGSTWRWSKVKTGELRTRCVSADVPPLPARDAASVQSLEATLDVPPSPDRTRYTLEVLGLTELVGREEELELLLRRGSLTQCERGPHLLRLPAGARGRR
jgi:hypothetical protein